MGTAGSEQVDIHDYVQDLIEGRLGVEVFCAAMRAVHREGAAVQALLGRSDANAQVVFALRRLTAGSQNAFTAGSQDPFTAGSQDPFTAGSQDHPVS